MEAVSDRRGLQAYLAAAARERYAGKSARATRLPRVLVETPAPPVFGKETPAGVVSFSACRPFHEL